MSERFKQFLLCFGSRDLNVYGAAMPVVK